MPFGRNDRLATVLTTFKSFINNCDLIFSLADEFERPILKLSIIFKSEKV